MHLTAESADAESLRLLAYGRLQRRDINVKNNRGLTPFQVGLQRDGTDAEWKEAFGDFLKAIDKDQPLQQDYSGGLGGSIDSVVDDGVGTDDYGLRQLFGDEEEIQ